ncbi:MAG: insulinase family protein, partial [Bacteroidota bacterium]
EIPKGTKEIPRPEVVEPALEAEVRDVVYDNIQLPALIHGFRIPAQGTDDFYAVDMLATMLAGGQSSRLYRSLVDDNQAAISTGAFPFQLEDPGLTLAFAILNPGITPEEAEALMDAEYEKAGKELMSDREFQKLRNQFENDLISANTSMAGIAESLANYHMYFGDANLINTEIDRYMAVTKEDIMRVAKTYFVPSNRVALTYLSKELEDKP